MQAATQLLAGRPCVDGTLLDAPAPALAPCALQAHPSALAALGLAAGDLALVARLQPQPPRGRRSSGASLDYGPEAELGRLTPERADSALVLGDILAVASLWPAPGLAATTLRASQALLDATGGPPAGGVLRVWALPPACTCAEATALLLTLLAPDEPLAPETPPPASPTPPTTPPARASPRASPGGGKAAPQTPVAKPGGRVGAVAAGWVARAGADATPATRELLGSLAGRLLEGRHLFPGACISLPLLGHRVRCRVDGCSAAEDATMYAVTPGTRVTLAWPGEAPVPPALAATAPDAAVVACQPVALGAQERFAALGGVDGPIAALRRLVVLPLRRPTLFAAAGLRPPRGVLLHGPPGTGKTRLARAAAAEAGVPLFVVSGPELVSEFYGESEARLRAVFAAAAAAAPAVIFLDELDALAPSRESLGGSGGSGDASTRIVATLLALLDGSGPEGLPAGVAVVAATNRPEAIDAALRRPGRFDAEIPVPPPSAAGRALILAALLRSVRHRVPDAEAAALAASLHGYSGADVGAVVAEAALCALRRAVAAAESGAGEAGVTSDDLASAARVVPPSGLRVAAVEPPPAAGAWEEVAGLDSVKKQLREVFEQPTPERAAALARLGVKPPRGVLLYGPPGCAKTSLARAVAAKSGRAFLAASGPDIYSLWVGESEKAVAALFAAARTAAPCVLFLDELDALAPTRSADGGTGARVTERVMAQLLQELDGGVGAAGAADVALLAATNRPDLIDPALLRPGRLDRLVYVPPPADATARAAIMAAQLRGVPLAGDVDLDGIAAGTDGFTGADLAKLCREAKLAAMEEEVDPAALAGRHFDAAREACSASPPVAAELRAVYAAMARA